MVVGINQDGYRVERANWLIYAGQASGVATLNGDGLPSASFRCSVTISAITGHSECAGSITIGSETLTFLAAGKKSTTAMLSALPVVSVAGLDCYVLIEAISAGGAPLIVESQVALKTRFMDTQKSFQSPAGAWSQSQAVADTTDSGCGIGDVYSFGGNDYDIAQVQAFANGAGSETYRRLYLTGKRLAATGRAVVDVSGDMRKAVYDSDLDGVVDKAEGIPVLDALPTDLTNYSVGDQFMVGNRKYTITDE